MMDVVDARGGGDVPDAKGMPGVPMDTAPVMSKAEFYADAYNMKHTNRGLGVIINNKTFDSKTGMVERIGTDVDASAMYDTLSLLGFEKIWVKHDLKVSEMRSVLRKAARDDHADSDCFVCVILTHGEEGFVFGYDGKIAIDELVAPFKGDKCLSLAGKPKIFFIQACRGSQLDSGVTMADAIGDMESDEVEQRRIPTEADFLLAYSVVPGFFAWRNSAKGSWFIQAIVQVFKMHWKNLDLLTMMTRVNNIVARDFQSNASKEYMNRKKQIPCITSMLTKEVFFLKK